MKQLETNRIKLIPITSEHSDAFFEMQNDPKMYEFVSESPLTLEEVKSRVSDMEKRVSPDNPEMKWLIWVVMDESNNLIGHLEIAIFKGYDDISLAYMFNSNYWSKGYAFESCSLIINHLKETLNPSNYFKLEIDSLNTPSISLAKKLGFSFIREEKDAQEVNGRMSHEFIYQLKV